MTKSWDELLDNGVVIVKDGCVQSGYEDEAKLALVGTLILPDDSSVTKVGRFKDCFYLTSVVIPDSVTSIDNQAFYATSLASIVIGDSVTSIGTQVFCYCDSLTSIVIPDSVTSIGSSVFYGCYSLADITFNGTMAQWNAIEKGVNWHLEVPATYVQCIDGRVDLD